MFGQKRVSYNNVLSGKTIDRVLLEPVGYKYADDKGKIRDVVMIAGTRVTVKKTKADKFKNAYKVVHGFDKRSVLLPLAGIKSLIDHSIPYNKEVDRSEYVTMEFLSVLDGMSGNFENGVPLFMLSKELDKEFDYQEYEKAIESLLSHNVIVSSGFNNTYFKRA